jgi:hypothetical protein
MKLSLRIVLLMLNIPMFACVCAYDYEKESETRRTVRDSAPCPSADVIASSEHAVEAELLSEDRQPQTPLCWYKLDIERGSLGRCSPSFEPFEPLAKLREQTTKAYEPDGTYAGHSSSSSVIQGRGAVVCTADEGPVVVWQSDKAVCDPTPDVSTWDDDVWDFWSGGMVVNELLATDERSTRKQCIYELTTEHHKPSCTSSNYWN